MIDSGKQRILLVEESATLRYILVKGLNKQGYELAAIDAFDAAFEEIRHNSTQYDAMVIGWPNYKNHENADRLIRLLEGEDHFELPVLVIAHDANVEVLNWMSRRHYAALVPWENYQEYLATLQKLLGPQTTQIDKYPSRVTDNPVLG